MHALDAYHDRVDLRALTTFRLVAETGSVSAAAQASHRSQPALSRQLQQLERELGIRLFDREKGKLHLTAAGKTFLDATVDVLTSAEAARSLATSLAAGRLARVRMAAPLTTLTDVVAPFLATLRPDDPLTTVEESNFAAAINGLRTRLDLVVVTSPPPQQLNTRQVAVLPVWAHVNTAHPLAGAAALSLAELSEHRLFMLDGDSRPRRLLEEAFTAAGLAAPEIVDCSNPQVAQALACAGRGVAVVSDDPRFGLKPLHILTSSGHLTLTLHAAWDPNHHAATQIAAMADRLSEFCRARYAPSGD